MPGLRSRLPFERTTFIGRERELTAAAELFDRSRLVTFVGTGGVGKTRLALELGSELEERFDAGAVLVELAALGGGGQVAAAIVQPLGLGESAQHDPIQAAAEAIGDAELLVLLDNCEHVVTECATLVDRLLKSCRRLHVLATSRQPLGISGEALFAVQPLKLPSSGDDVDVGASANSEAIRLFVDRAQLVRSDFQLKADNVEAVSGICRRLDGLPLAIELAAARVRAMSPTELFERLDDQFALLGTPGAGVAPPRQQTLEATLDWSHGLLSDDERTLFRRLAVFSGGWTLPDAESVCAFEGLPAARILPVHTALVDRSLIVAEPADRASTRHRLLETVRAYAARRLGDPDELAVLRARHFERFLFMAEEYYEQRSRGGPDAALPDLAAGRDNFRTALTWAIDHDAEGSLRMASALEDLWRMVGAAEGWRWLERALPLSAPDSPHRVRALLTAGMLAAYVPAYAEGAGLLSEASERARATGDRTSEAWAELWLGRLAFFTDDVDRAESHLRTAVALHGSLDNALGEVRALALIGLVEGLGRHRTAEATTALHRAVALARQHDDGWGEGYARLMLGLTVAEAGDLTAARQHFRDALSQRRLGSILGVPLQRIARTLIPEDPTRALQLLGAAARHFRRTGTLQPGFVQRRADAACEQATRRVGQTKATEAFEAGLRLRWDEACALALADPGRRAAPATAGLTRRETEVAGLVARGMSNRDIATALFLSVRTIESHVDRALTKLGLHNRTQLAAWARDHDVEIRAGMP